MVFIACGLQFLKMLNDIALYPLNYVKLLICVSDQFRWVGPSMEKEGERTALEEITCQVVK